MLAFRPFTVADRLRANALSESQKAGIVMLGVFVGALAGRGSVLSIRDWSTGAFYLVYLSFALGGFWSCFRVNEAGDNERFIERYACLAIPAAIWTYGLYVAAYYASWYAMTWRRPATPALIAVYGDVAKLGSLVALLAFYSFVRSLLRRVAAPRVAS